MANMSECGSRRCICRDDRSINSCVSFYIPYISTIFLFEELMTVFTGAFNKVLLKVQQLLWLCLLCGKPEYKGIAKTHVVAVS